jgi:hypothetical protein
MTTEVLIHAWRHEKTRRIHVRPDCHAVKFLREQMEPVLIRADDPELLASTCSWCFPERRATESEP